jgi:serine phosphatase RsbU (regulator of sigma subunit)
MSDDGSEHTPGGFRGPGGRTTAESLGEALLGSLLDRAHLLPPRLVGPLVAEEAVAAGATRVQILLQDLDQVHLHPLEGPGLHGERTPIAGSAAGRAFATDSTVEESQPDGSVRLHLPMLDGSDRVGVLSLDLPAVSDDDRRLARRLAGLVADLVVTKSEYTDTFDVVRSARPLSLSALLQRRMLPPLAMKTPDVELAGVLEPAYEVGGDGFDYAFDEHVLHVAVFDAMGHGLDAAVMSTVLVSSYRHGRRVDRPLPELYAEMDRVLAGSFPGRFATAQLVRLDTVSGELSWVNAGHPPPLWVRDDRVLGTLTGPVTRPVGFGGATPQVRSTQLEPGDRVLFFTDGVVEERLDGGEQFGEARLRELVVRSTAERLPTAEAVRQLSHALMAARDGRTTDDASLVLLEWKGTPDDDELAQNSAVTAGR